MQIVPRVRLLLSVLVLAVLATACAGGNEALAVCSDIPYRPFEFEEGGEFTGFDIELMRAIGERLGHEVEVQQVGFEALQSGVALNAGRCDVVASAMTITEDREKNIDFSDPYYEAVQSLLTPVDSGVRTLADTAGRTLGVQSGTTGEAYADEHAPDGATIRRFRNAGTMFTALQAGQIDAVLQDLPANAEYARDRDDVEVVETYDTGEQYGFAVREEGSEELLEGINRALAELRTEGTYDELYERFFGTG